MTLTGEVVCRPGRRRRPWREGLVRETPAEPSLWPRTSPSRHPEPGAAGVRSSGQAPSQLVVEWTRALSLSTCRVCWEHLSDRGVT